MTGASLVFAFGLWGALDVAGAMGERTSSVAHAAAGLAYAFALGLPVVLLAAFSNPGRLRDAYRAWAGVAAFAALAALIRLWPKGSTQPAALTLIAVCVIAWRAVGRYGRGRPAGPPNAAFIAAGLGALSGWMWLRWGALGSMLDTLLAAAAAAALAAAAARWFSRALFAGAPEPGRVRDILFEGITLGAGLMALGAAAGFDGAQILLVVPLGALGIAAAAAWRAGGPAAIAALLAPSIALPMALVDPDELTILLGERDVLAWVPVAIAVAAATGLAVSAAALVARRARPSAAAATAFAGAAALILLATYALGGRPGGYGDRLFVILRDQADLRSVSAIDDRDARMKAVYEALTAHASATQAPLRKALSDLGLAYKPYYLVNALEVEGGLEARAMLANRPEVDRVLDSPRLRPLPIAVAMERGDAPPPVIPQWNLTLIGADRVWSELRVTGEGIVVGQSDSGVDGTHPALRNAYRGRGGRDDANWLDPWNGTRAPVDVGGHGTHTLGTVLGRAVDRNAPTGVAPGAEWFGCVNLARNLANPALYLECLQFMLAPWPQSGDPFKDGNPKLGAHVINNSWGCPPLEGCDPDALRPAVAALRAAGVFVVAAAGNDGPRCETVRDPIALYPEAFSVAAVDAQGSIAEFSSRGPVSVDGSGRTKPDIAAPGVGVLSTLPGGTYGANSGTSMAGPHVAGVVALLWSAQPKLIGNIDATERILRETARPAPAGSPTCGGQTANVFGAGVVDAYAAVKAALAYK